MSLTRELPGATKGRRAVTGLVPAFCFMVGMGCYPAGFEQRIRVGLAPGIAAGSCLFWDAEPLIAFISSLKMAKKKKRGPFMTSN